MTKSVNVPLETPITDGDNTITSLTVRKPAPGELRGLSLSHLLNGDADSHMKLLPRITSPINTEDEIKSGKIDVSDFSALVNEVIDFLLPPLAKASLQKT
jgi:hypothetical protein